MKKFQNSELDEIEQKMKINFPDLYRKLLIDVGAGEFGKEEMMEIYHPEEIWDLYEPFFEDPDQIFNPYFPFGCNNRTQELWVIDSRQKKAAAISHETVPDDWDEEEWLSYDSWLAEYFEY